MQLSDFQSIFPTLSSKWRSTQTFVIQASTGLGKSTRIPIYIADSIISPTQTVFCLEPRRVAAVGLANRVSEEKNEPVGNGVGYHVRGESKHSVHTKLSFQTYGWFLRYAAQNPELTDVAAVILDEFHERSAEMDLALAFIRHRIQREKADTKLVIMSATLDLEALLKYCPRPLDIKVDSPGYPVDVSHLTPMPGEALWEHLYRAVRELLGRCAKGTVLVFLPGQYEIQKAENRLSEFCGKYGIRLEQLYGAQTLSVQKKVLNETIGGGLRIVLSTNIAESALTIPDVCAVIDSGLAKTSVFDEFRMMNHLETKKCSKFNIIQRQGRAGRTGPGLSIRLWNKAWEQSLPPYLAPEVMRLDLTQTQLHFLQLFSKTGNTPSIEGKDVWLSPPDREKWLYAFALLKKLECVTDSGMLGPLADAVSQLPLHPRLAYLFLKGRVLGLGNVSATMVCIVQECHSLPTLEGDLYQLAACFPETQSKYPESFKTTLHQVRRTLVHESSKIPGGSAMPDALFQKWYEFFGHHLAANTEADGGYRMLDGRIAFIRNVSKRQPAPPVVLPVTLHEKKSGGQKKRVIQLWLPVSVRWLLYTFPDALTSNREPVWNPRSKKVEIWEQTLFKKLPIRKRLSRLTDADKRRAGEILYDYIVENRHELRLSDETEMYLSRIRLLSTAFPEYQIPSMDDEDWSLVLSECCEQKVSVKALSPEHVLTCLKSYIGPVFGGMVDNYLPLKTKLPSGKTGRYSYSKDEPPELSARIGDFIGLKGEHHLCEGRVRVRYNILAPNFRTAQKTWDLSGFWKQTYPELKKELKRRYPKHPWP